MTESEWLGDPLVIDPPNFDQKAGWQECREYVDQCGGLAYKDGEPNWRAAFGADPGCCSCPLCDSMYWAWGNVQECKKCGFRYPTDWWAMYSWGGQAAQRGETAESHKGEWRRRWDQKMQHKYFRWAYEHKATPTMEAAHVVAWNTIFPEDAVNLRRPS